MARLYTNENFPQQAVEVLRALGHDVETSHDADNSGSAMSDKAVFDYASEQQRVIVTLNRRHFIALHKKYPDHSGIMVCTFDPDFNALAGRIHLVLKKRFNQKGVLSRINRIC